MTAPHHLPLHRGLGLKLDPEDHAIVHGSGSAHDRAQHLLHLISHRGLGTHWTTDEHVAHDFARSQAQTHHMGVHDWEADGEENGYNRDGSDRHQRTTRVVLHAAPPEREHIDSRESDAYIHGYDQANIHGQHEREVPLHSGAPVHLTGITWGTTSHHADDQDDDPDERVELSERRTASRLDFRSVAAAQERLRCPCGMPVEYDPQDGWQHADGSISHDGEFYPYSVSDLMERHARRLGSHVPASPLYDSPSRWRFKQHEWDTRDQHNIEHTKPFGEYTLHAEPKYDDGDRQLHVTTADGQHVGEAYTGDHPTRPGHIELAPEVHPDHRRKGIGTALYDYAEELAGKPAAPADEHTDAAEAFWQHRKQGRYSAPTKRIFGPTFGLDARLWDGDQLRPAIRHDVLNTFAAFCIRHGYRAFREWARVVFFGSEASEWTSKKLRGNDDFDLSIGIEYTLFRSANPSFHTASDEQIAAALTQEMHAELNDEHKTFPGIEGTYDQTWFANLYGWDIRRIRPYAAYNVFTGEWIVKPPHLEHWSIHDFPEGKGLEEEVHGVILAAQGILAMPEPYRTQNGAAFWEFIHSNRSDAFGPEGEGWWDARNVIEKALDQKGLMQQLWKCHRRAVEDPSSLASPVDWSNAPVRAG